MVMHFYHFLVLPGNGANSLFFSHTDIIIFRESVIFSQEISLGLS
jgi:hypothetical protein